MQKRKRGQIGFVGAWTGGWIPPRRQKNKGVRHCHLCPSRRAQGRAAEGEWSGAHRPRRRGLAARPGGESGAPRPRSGPGRSLIQALQASENTAWEEAQAQPEKSGQASVSAAGGPPPQSHSLRVPLVPCPPRVLLVSRPSPEDGRGQPGEGAGPEVRPRLTLSQGEPGGLKERR